jgi:hypothetical protein
MNQFIYEKSQKFSELFEYVFSSTTHKYFDDMPAILAFYIASSDIGDNILTFERETIEFIFANKGVSHNITDKINAIIAIANQMDYVLSTADGFLYAAVVLNDLGPVPENIGSVTVDHMVWAVILLMALYGASNFPLVGEAAEAVAIRLQEEGWTTPPVFIDSPKVFMHMPYADKNLQIVANKHRDRFFHINNPETKAHIDNQYDNYFEMHKGLLHYLEMEDTKLTRLIGGIQ